MGLLSGLRTILWGMVILTVMVYTVAVVLTQEVGQTPVPRDAEQQGILMYQQLFSTVPRSMFTIFRCVTDDCTFPNGSPIVVAMMEKYGILFVLPYCFFFALIVFGLFNLL